MIIEGFASTKIRILENLSPKSACFAQKMKQRATISGEI